MKSVASEVHPDLVAACRAVRFMRVFTILPVFPLKGGNVELVKAGKVSGLLTEPSN